MLRGHPTSNNQDTIFLSGVTASHYLPGANVGTIVVSSSPVEITGYHKNIPDTQKRGLSRERPSENDV